MNGLDLLGDTRGHRRVEPVIALAHQRFARDFEKDATILQIGRHAARAHPAERPATAGSPKITPKSGYRSGICADSLGPAEDQVFSWAPTSAAKSDGGRSTPSPSAKRTNP